MEGEQELNDGGLLTTQVCKRKQHQSVSRNTHSQHRLVGCRMEGEQELKDGGLLHRHVKRKQRQSIATHTQSAQVGWL